VLIAAKGRGRAVLIAGCGDLRYVTKQRPNVRSVKGRQGKNYETQKDGVAKQRAGA